MTSGASQRPGLLVLVVGPSGAGKDALIAAARAQFAGSPDFVLARRVVTRTAQEAAEDHDTLTPEDFDLQESLGGFAMSWRAHGLAYGIPAAIRADIAAGRTVVANVSRGSIAQAERWAERILVLHVTAPPEILAARLAQRGREASEDIAARVARQAAIHVAHARVVNIHNGGRFEDALCAFVDALRESSALQAEHRP